eukprot:GHVQ01038807.1.p1 GENE.GHVQ01038807.1~~GHVQ01038807.1.p1  ORF type:complete len:248 (-),score=43.95 GHVQ01038807.1:1339-2082(-)
MGLRHVERRPVHLERAQPHRRKRLGLLEKPKDYKKRAVKYHEKQKRLHELQEKARLANQDEFNFGMLTGICTDKGVKVNAKLSPKQSLLLDMERRAEQQRIYSAGGGAFKRDGVNTGGEGSWQSVPLMSKSVRKMKGKIVTDDLRVARVKSVIAGKKLEKAMTRGILTKEMEEAIKDKREKKKREDKLVNRLECKQEQIQTRRVTWKERQSVVSSGRAGDIRGKAKPGRSLKLVKVVEDRMFVERKK